MNKKIPIPSLPESASAEAAPVPAEFEDSLAAAGGPESVDEDEVNASSGIGCRGSFSKDTNSLDKMQDDASLCKYALVFIAHFTRLFGRTARWD